MPCFYTLYVNVSIYLVVIVILEVTCSDNTHSEVETSESGHDVGHIVQDRLRRLQRDCRALRPRVELCGRGIIFNVKILKSTFEGGHKITLSQTIYLLTLDKSLIH